MSKLRISLFAALIIGLFPFSADHAMAGTANISGSVGLTVESGKFIPGRMVTVFLVTEEIEVPENLDTKAFGQSEQIEILNKCHMDFFKTFWKKSLNPEYLIADTVTNADGVFEFENITSGKYYVLVAFPTILGGYKVAWQVPVALDNESGNHVKLHNENLLLPAYSRYNLLR